MVSGLWAGSHAGGHSASMPGARPSDESVGESEDWEILRSTWISFRTSKEGGSDGCGVVSGAVCGRLRRRGDRGGRGGLGTNQTG